MPSNTVTALSVRLAATGLTKRFGAVLANDGVDIELAAGEVHLILGENGAGKSTTIGMIAGRTAPDAGAIRVDGDELEPGSARRAAALGVIAVYQDSMFVPTLTAIENARVAIRASGSGTSEDELRTLIAATIERYDLGVNLDAPVGTLLLSDRQKVELVWALAQRPKVLLLDEPTGLLPPLGTPPFLDRLRRLAQEGLAIGMVTHRLSEVEMIADRVTVMRGGRVVGRFDRAALPTDQQLSALIMGLASGQTSAQPGARGPDRRPIAKATAALDINGLAVDSEHFSRGVHDVALTVRAGEIVGIAGIDGNGQDSLLQAIAGLRELRSGTVTLDGHRIESRSYRQRLEAGIGYLPGDRKRFAIFPNLTVAENLAIGQRTGLRGAADIIRALAIRPDDEDYPADRLSGGNQQKLALGRVILRRPKVMLLEYPFRGLDIMAMQSVRDLLARSARDGVGILLAASDLDELFGVCDRILVMDRGRIVSEEWRERFDSQRIGELLTTS